MEDRKRGVSGEFFFGTGEDQEFPSAGTKLLVVRCRFALADAQVRTRGSDNRISQRDDNTPVCTLVTLQSRHPGQDIASGGHTSAREATRPRD